MATTVSTINEALVDNRVVAALRTVVPLLKFFSYQIDLGEKTTSDVVYVPIATDPSVGNKTAGTFVTAGGTVAGTSVTLSRFRGAAWDATEGSMRSELLASYWADKAAGAVYVCAKDVIDYALTLVLKATYGDADADKLVIAPGDFGQEDLASLWGKGVAKIKNQTRNVLLNTAYAQNLFGTSQIALIYANAGNNFLSTGILPQMLGMNVAHYTDIPTNSEDLGGMVIGRAAILIATAKPSQLMASGEGNIKERRFITDADSGLTVQYTVKADAGGTLSGECAILYGCAAGQNAIVRLVNG
jgi:hypothetical protein